MSGKAKPKTKGTSRASKPRKSATRSKSPPKAGAKTKPGAGGRVLIIFAMSAIAPCPLCAKG
jgi:hypothetical protein